MARADATADELHALIVAREQELAQVQLEKAQVIEQVEEAERRQSLRRRLEKAESLLASARSSKETWQNILHKTNHDMVGPNLPSLKNALVVTNDSEAPKSISDLTDCGENLGASEIEWRIAHMSWMRNTLIVMDSDTVWSNSVENHGHSFYLEYHPERGHMGSNGCKGSLVLYHEIVGGQSELNFRYTMWIKSKDRGFVQWGDSNEICIVDRETDDMIFGPDVCAASATPAGIFGLSHEQLLKSEWVVDDTLTAKVKIEVRGCSEIVTKTNERCEIAVPNSQLGQDLLLLLESGTNSDVTFVFQGGEVRAHSTILAARSEVFQRQLSCGLQESTSKRIDIEDCDQAVFKAALQYLYSDNFDCVEKCIAEKITESHTSSNGRASSSSKTCGIRVCILQQLLAVSHKYQFTRLQLWCERELCTFVSIEDVCSILCQAHLYEARHLEQACLLFIKTHITEVCKSESFGALLQAWPEVSLKIALRASDVPEDMTSTILQNARKRKRED